MDLAHQLAGLGRDDGERLRPMAILFFRASQNHVNANDPPLLIFVDIKLLWVGALVIVSERAFIVVTPLMSFEAFVTVPTPYGLPYRAPRNPVKSIASRRSRLEDLSFAGGWRYPCRVAVALDGGRYPSDSLSVPSRSVRRAVASEAASRDACDLRGDCVGTSTQSCKRVAATRFC